MIARETYFLYMQGRINASAFGIVGQEVKQLAREGRRYFLKVIPTT